MMAPAIAALYPFARELINKIWPDPAQQAEAQLRLETLAQNGQLAALAAETDLMKGQMAINAAEAAQPRTWITWREGFGWVCVLTVGFKFIGGPLLFMVGQAMGLQITLPVVDSSELWMPLMGMLGLGTLGTVQAIKGTK